MAAKMADIFQNLLFLTPRLDSLYVGLPLNQIWSLSSKRFKSYSQITNNGGHLGGHLEFSKFVIFDPTVWFRSCRPLFTPNLDLIVQPIQKLWPNNENPRWPPIWPTYSKFVIFDTTVGFLVCRPTSVANLRFIVQTVRELWLNNENRRPSWRPSWIL